MRVLLDEDLLYKTTMTFPLYALRSAPIHAFNPLNPPYQGDFKRSALCVLCLIRDSDKGHMSPLWGLEGGAIARL